MAGGEGVRDCIRFEQRAVAQFRSLGIGAGDERLAVAVSGGIDSVVLLYLARFRLPELSGRLVVLHFDHAMRSDSAADADWVAGLCRAWGVPLLSERAEARLGSEDEARSARHDFLRRAAVEAGAARIALAHHADDQAETVLFRALRGTGLEGLAGMSACTRSGLVRPLLPFWRKEILAFARARRLRWREDPTNGQLRASRNRIRNELLPLIESGVAPGARRNLVRLAALAREAEIELVRRVREAESETVQQQGDAFLLARERLQTYSSAVASRVLRRVLRRCGVVLDGAGTRAALQFITGAPSGRVLELPRGVRAVVEFGNVRILREPVVPRTEQCEIRLTGPRGDGELDVGGTAYRVRWSIGAAGPQLPLDEQLCWTARLAIGDAAMPLVLRGWRAGDRIRTAGGTKKLKRLFVERRVPRSLRTRLPLLADAEGRLLWVAGIDDAGSGPPDDGTHALFLLISND